MPSGTGSPAMTPASSPSLHGLRLFRSIAFVLMSCSLAAGCGGPAEASPRTDVLEPVEEPGGQVQSPAQSCAAVWLGDRQMATTKADEITSVWVDESGNILTTGFENGTVGQTNIEPSGNSRGVVRKYWPSGVTMWTKNIETAGTDTVEHLISGPDGHVIVVGRTTDVVSGSTNGGQFDLFAMELGAGGTPVSSLQAGDVRPQHPVKIASTSQGNLVVAGYDDLFVDHQQVMDSENSFLSSYVPYPAQERWRWRSESLENPDRITGMTLNAPYNDEIYVSGFKFFEDAESFGGAFVRRYDLSGQQIWATQIGFVATEVDELLISPLGELFAAGSTQLPTIGGEGRGLSDAYIASIDRITGTVLWASKVGTSEHDFVTAFAQGPNGDLYVAGDTFGAFPGFTNQGERDLFVLRFSSTGQLLSIWQRGTSAREHAAGLWVDACNNIYLGGFTEGGLVPGAVPKGRDSFLLKVTMP